MSDEQAPAPPSTPPTPAAAPETPSAAPESAPVTLTQPPHDVAETIALREENPGLRRVPSQQNLVDLAAPPPGQPPAQPVRQTRIFGAMPVAPNEFKITAGGQDLGGKILTPTEVPVVLGWLNSLPPE